MTQKEHFRPTKIMKVNLFYYGLVFADDLKSVEGYNLTIDSIARILRCSRRYVALKVQPHLDYVRIPPINQWKNQLEPDEFDDAKNSICEQMNVLNLDLGKIFPQIWIKNESFIKYFNDTFKPCRRTAPLSLKKLFPKHEKEAEKIFKSRKLANTDKRSKLHILSEECGTIEFFKQTYFCAPSRIATDRTKSIPFTPIKKPIKRLEEMDFVVASDYNYASKATKELAKAGAIAYKAKGKTLYLIPKLTEIEKALLAPACVVHNHKHQNS